MGQWQSLQKLMTALVVALIAALVVAVAMATIIKLTPLARLSGQLMRLITSNKNNNNTEEP